MSENDARGVFEAYLKATNARDVQALESLVHEDFEDRYPQSGERTVGFANLRAIIANYPAGGYEGQGTGRIVGTEDRWVLTPAFTVLRIEGRATRSRVSRAVDIPMARTGTSLPSQRSAMDASGGPRTTSRPRLKLLAGALPGSPKTDAAISRHDRRTWVAEYRRA